MQPFERYSPPAQGPLVHSVLKVVKQCKSPVLRIDPRADRAADLVAARDVVRP
jgi:hypothetical protein